MARESVDIPEMRLLGRALGMVRKRAGMSQEQAGEAYGISGEGWRKYESGAAKAIFSPDTQDRLARAVGAARDDIIAERARLAGEDAPAARITPGERASWAQARAPELTLLPIRDTVQAGAWLMADDSRQVAASHPVARDPRFPNAHQWLSEVRGDSMNALNIVDGDLVHCVDAVEIGYYPRTGDVVEVERSRFDGQERELTLKQIEVRPDGILLWPRSSNVRWKSPLELRDGVGPDEEISISVRSLVLASVRRF
jgi:SOS-response transcriptional repressor LexA